ncbi:hypothetical protein HAX54_043628 [Datura stramonium]|uniref:Uncharacterized protein n=1 Tax=Datura stramonium TaxID=4076 RepID=A0ABS8W4S1_DATST|nr:hypothetical protein [Datura stramonium]
MWKSRLWSDSALGIHNLSHMSESIFFLLLIWQDLGLLYGTPNDFDEWERENMDLDYIHMESSPHQRPIPHMLSLHHALISLLNLNRIDVEGNILHNNLDA